MHAKYAENPQFPLRFVMLLDKFKEINQIDLIDIEYLLI